MTQRVGVDETVQPHLVDKVRAAGRGHQAGSVAGAPRLPSSVPDLTQEACAVGKGRGQEQWGSPSVPCSAQ